MEGRLAFGIPSFMPIREDVQHMVDTGLEAYRFSISWSRLIPDGRGRVNPKGLEYYNNLINELLMHGIQPHVTLFHFDTPQVLEDEYGGWLSRKIVNDFTAYADVCFKEFGDRVLYWTTINEGNVFAMGGYDNGIAPPGRCSFPFGLNCSKGNSITEPYIAGHNMLLAHSSAVKLYYKKHKVVTHGIEDVTTAYFIVVLPFLTVSDVFKSFFIGIDQWFWCGQNIDHFECSEKETNTFLPTNEIPSIKPLKLDNIGCQIFQDVEPLYQATQHGFVGLNIYAPWFSPYSNATEDKIATQRAIDFYIGWFLHPMVFGDYPHIIKKNAGTKIPALTPRESRLLKGSFDFIGLNHYLTLYVKDSPSSLNVNIRDIVADMGLSTLVEPEDAPENQNDDTSSSLSGILEYLRNVYANPPTYIHENGKRTERNGTLNDTSRVKYMYSYIRTLLDAIKNGSNTKGYFLWSLLDGFEPIGGYTTSFGLYYVDLDDKQLKRYPKLSAHWYSNFLKGRTIKPDEINEVVNEIFVSSTSKASDQ
ncbi:beta-glucosidase 11-like isoform X2 [Coffea arabica]|uniref:Beta-glucosidase 11-like isoform X2 n=1 Tax=Coffea arabica TaxID=13443 RepID=A0ABM4WJ99_COFAR